MEPGCHLAIKPLDSQPRDINVEEKPLPLPLVFPSDADLNRHAVKKESQVLCYYSFFRVFSLRLFFSFSSSFSLPLFLFLFFSLSLFVFLSFYQSALFNLLHRYWFLGSADFFHHSASLFYSCLFLLFLLKAFEPGFKLNSVLRWICGFGSSPFGKPRRCVLHPSIKGKSLDGHWMVELDRFILYCLLHVFPSLSIFRDLGSFKAANQAQGVLPAPTMLLL